jgi:hypothetical protein
MMHVLGYVLVAFLVLMLAGFVLAHFGLVVVLVLGLVLVGRYLRRHGG